MENPSSLPFLLVTANVGSVFEDPSRLLHIWIKEFLAHVATRRPAFIALHMQEVGGKTYEKSMEYVQEFIKNLCESAELADYNRIRVYLDEDYNSAEHFTALGNLYFAIRTIENLQMWNFLTHEWEIVEGKSIHTGNIESVATKEKAKFPQQFFPECKWSRKGFLRTRWSLNGTVFDLVNIHLFHDASNLAACEEYPSVYCKSRRRALVHTLERFHKDAINKAVPYFVFGDFNFRCDTEGVVKKLTEDLTMHRIPSAKNDSTKVQYRDSDGANVLTVGKKEFTHSDQSTFKETWMRQFDRELDSLRSILHEYPITFPPSYPYEEDPQQPGSYMSTRCPAWCDRILISPAARRLIADDRNTAGPAGRTAGDNATSYGIIGDAVCMGDHKPVYLNLQVKMSQGILNNCSCDTHAHKRVEHISHSSTVSVNLSNNHDASSLSSVLVSNRVSSSDYGSTNEAPSSNDEPSNKFSTDSTSSPCILPSSEPITSNPAPQPNSHTHCPHCFEHVQSVFDEILSELDQSETSNPGEQPQDQDHPTKSEPISPTKPPPPVRISVFDTESNANVCMCSLYSSSFSIGASGELRRSQAESLNCLDSSLDAAAAATSPQICPNCRNIIKHQPLEHRKTLVSRRLMLANDIIVNRIDTHYLNTYTSPSGLASMGPGGAAACGQFEPYTPESVESHSPVPESTIIGLDFDSDSQTVTSALLAETPQPSLNETLQPLNVTASTVNTSTVVVTMTTKKNPPANNNNNITGVATATGGCGGVSPRQLKSRLEKLKRISDRRKTYQQSRTTSNSGGTMQELAASAGRGVGGGGGEEMVALTEEDARNKELSGSAPAGATEMRPASAVGSESKLIDCCRRHCCAIL